MLLRIESAKTEIKTDLLGGHGDIAITSLVSEKGMSPKTRMFARAVLEKGCSVGSHPHMNETEYFHIISGEGVYEEDGMKYKVSPGDTTACGNGSSHAIANEKNEPLVFMAVIVLD